MIDILVEGMIVKVKWFIVKVSLMVLVLLSVLYCGKF